MSEPNYADKYRPQTFGQVYGQESVVACLSGLVTRGRRGRHILLQGERGSGKTSLARIFGRALNCAAPDPDGSPCLTRCESCRSVNGGQMPFMHEYNVGREGGDVEPVRNWVRERNRDERRFRYRILFFDEAHVLSPRACDALLGSVEHPNEGVLFFFATTEPERLRPALRSRLFDLLIRPLPAHEAVAFLRRYAAAECLDCEPGALELLAGLRNGYPRDLLLGLDRVVERSRNRLTIAMVRAAFDVDQTEVLLAYFEALATGDVAQQTEIVFGWRERAADKIRWIQAVLLSLYHNDILRRRLIVDGLIAAIPESARTSILDRFRARLGLPSTADLAPVWQRLMAFWSGPETAADETALSLRLTLFHELVNAPAGDGGACAKVLASPGSRADAAPSSAKTLRGFGLPSLAVPVAPITATEPGFLSGADVRAIINSASFLVQEHAAPFNLAFEITPSVLGAATQASALALIKAFSKDLAAQAEAWDSLLLASLTVLERDELGTVARIVARLSARHEHETVDGDALGHVEAWARNWSWHDMPANSIAAIRVERAALGRSAALAFHWLHVHSLCAGLDPEVTAWDPATGRHRSLLRLLGVRPRTTGPILGDALVKVSGCLSEAAIAAACHNRLAPLSAFDDGAWSAITACWEWDEVRERRATRAEREGEIQRLRQRFGDDTPEARAAIEAAVQRWPVDPRAPTQVAGVVGMRGVGAMRDIDYLLAAQADGPPALVRALIYRYRSGILRPRMMSVLSASAAQQGRPWTPGALPLQAGFAEGGLIDGLMVYDWPAGPGRGLDAIALRSSLQLLAGSIDLPSVHFVPHDSAVVGYSDWRRIERGAVILEEPEITRETLRPVLRYLQASTKLAHGADFLAQPGFVASFTELVEEQAGLPEILHAFEERLLLCTDPVTHRFNADRYERESKRRFGQRAPLRHLRDFTALRREDDLVDLLCGLDERRAECGWTAFRLVADLYRMSGKLLQPSAGPDTTRSTPRSRATAYRMEEGALLWAALVLAFEESLHCSLREEEDQFRRGPDPLVPALAALGRDFLAREARMEIGDPLTDRWPALIRTLGRCGADDRLARARQNLMHELATALASRRASQPAWMRRLHTEVLTAVAHVTPCACADDRPVETKPDVFAPQTFEAVIGRAHAVAALRGHVCRGAAGADLLLYGPHGVGKRTLARVYARAVLCETPQPGGSACGACSACRHFNDGSPNFFEVDGMSRTIAEKTKHLVDVIQHKLWGDRCVVMVQNADHYPPHLFDKLLKPMEDCERASFVLLAQNRDAVRLAGQSRCFDYRVRPLNQTQTAALLDEILTTHGLACSEAARAVLVDASAGLPGRLIEACASVADTKTPSTATVRTRLGLDWAEDVLAAWPKIVGGHAGVLPELMRSSSTNRAEQVRRVQATLQLIRLGEYKKGWESPDATDPALRHLDEDARARLAAALVRQADQDGMTSETLWTRLVARWRSD